MRQRARLVPTCVCVCVCCVRLLNVVVAPGGSRDADRFALGSTEQSEPLTASFVQSGNQVKCGPAEGLTRSSEPWFSSPWSVTC